MTCIPFHPKPCDARKGFSKLWVPLPPTTHQIVRRLDVSQLSSWATVRAVILNTPDVRAKAASNDKLRYINWVTSINYLYDSNFYLLLYLFIMTILCFKNFWTFIQVIKNLKNLENLATYACVVSFCL